MKWLAVVIVVLCAVADSSVAWWSEAAKGAPILTLTTIIALYAILDFERVFIPTIFGGLTLDLYSGLRFGSLTLLLFLIMLGAEVIRGRWLEAEGALPSLLLATYVALGWEIGYWLISILSFGKVHTEVPIRSILLTLGVVIALSVVARSLIERIMAGVGYYPRRPRIL